MKQTYAVVFEETPNNYCAYVPDLPGCISTGKTWDEMQLMIREAIAFHIEGMLEDGEPFPEPRMSIEEAVAYHNEPLTKHEKGTLAEYGGPAPSLSTTFQMIEVEFAVPRAAQDPALPRK